MSQPDVPIIMSTTDTAEVIEAGAPVRKGRKGLFTAVIAAGVTLALMVGVGVAYRVMAGESKRPEQFIPASVVAFVAVDLDPSLEQKLQLLKLAGKLPQGEDANAIKDGRGLLDRTLTQMELPGVNVRRDLTSWLGMRLGVAFWLDAQRRPFALISATSRDDAMATAGLRRIAAGQRDAMGFVVRDGGALIAFGGPQAQQAAEAAAAEARKTPLSTSKSFSDARGWLADEQLAIAWTDLDKLNDAMSALMETRMSGGEKPPSSQADAATGTYIMGVRLTGDGVEARFRGFGTPHKGAGLTDALARLGELPGNTELAMVTKVADDFGKDTGSPFSAFGNMFGAFPAMFLGLGPTFTRRGSTEGPASPVFTDAEGKEFDKLVSIEPGKRTKAQNKRLSELFAKMGLSPDDVADTFGGTDAFQGTGPTGGGMAEPADPTWESTQKVFAALAGATLSVAVTNVTSNAAVRAIAEAISPEAAKTLGTVGENSKGEVTATVRGTTVTAVSKGYAAGAGKLADQAGFQAAMAGAPASTELAIYVNLAKVVSPEGRAKFPVNSLSLMQGTEDGDMTGLVRLIIG